jgi:hypothetical protein
LRSPKKSVNNTLDIGLLNASALKLKVECRGFGLHCH